MTDPNESQKASDPKLSICIATYNRGRFIGDTLGSVLSEPAQEVEIIVVDGASQDNTAEVVERYASTCSQIRYFREQANSGVDVDYDKAIGYAKGNYCWLLTDDDLLRPGALSRVFALLDGARDLIIANGEIKNADLSKVLARRALGFENDREYRVGEAGRLFSEIGNYLSFIGGFIVKREFWMTRDRASFYGTLFVHVAVAFQHPAVQRAYVISDPLITIRYGNAMWSLRGFEIWMFKWPRLIWSFNDFSVNEKSNVCSNQPWKHIRKLVYYRGIGAYSINEYRRFYPAQASAPLRLLAFMIALAPGWLSNFVASLYCIVFNRKALVSIYDLSRSPHSTWIGRLGIRYLEADT